MVSLDYFFGVISQVKGAINYMSMDCWTKKHAEVSFHFAIQVI